MGCVHCVMYVSVKTIVLCSRPKWQFKLYEWKVLGPWNFDTRQIVLSKHYPGHIKYLESTVYHKHTSELQLLDLHQSFGANLKVALMDLQSMNQIQRQRTETIHQTTKPKNTNQIHLDAQADRELSDHAYLY